MEKHIVKVLHAGFITHNVKQFIVEKPAGYSFISGQATDVAINKPGLENELRPFTFTSVNDAAFLEFTIKIYTGHNGVTEKLGEINAGDELIIHEVFGSITFKAPGIFIAGGAGITPFISIFRQLKLNSKLPGNTLLFANHSEEDIIKYEELKDMLGDNYIDVLAHPAKNNKDGKRIDEQLLKYFINPKACYYICGPDQFVADISADLQSLGIEQAKIIIEQ